jgi:DNA-binding transcriptional ArsR family regulator
MMDLPTKGEAMPMSMPVDTPESEITLDRVLAALADPIRRDVLADIAKRGPLFCGEYKFTLSKSTMSHHLKFLRESGLMHTEVMGTRRQITRRDAVIERKFPGLLASVGLPAGKGQYPS